MHVEQLPFLLLFDRPNGIGEINVVKVQVKLQISALSDGSIEVAKR